MKRSWVRLRSLLKREQGQGLTEYLLMVSLVAIGMLSVLTSLSAYLTGPVQQMITQNLSRIPGFR